MEEIVIMDPASVWGEKPTEQEIETIKKFVKGMVAAENMEIGDYIYDEDSIDMDVRVIPNIYKPDYVVQVRCRVVKLKEPDLD